MQEVLEVSLLDPADGVPVQVQKLQVRENAQSVPWNRPAGEHQPERDDVEMKSHHMT